MKILLYSDNQKPVVWEDDSKAIIMSIYDCYKANIREMGLFTLHNCCVSFIQWTIVFNFKLKSKSRFYIPEFSSFHWRTIFLELGRQQSEAFDKTINMTILVFCRDKMFFM